MLTRGLLIDLLRAAPAAGSACCAPGGPGPCAGTYTMARAASHGSRWMAPACWVPVIRPAGGGRCGFVLLWDDPLLDVEALRPRLRALCPGDRASPAGSWCRAGGTRPCCWSPPARPAPRRPTAWPARWPRIWTGRARPADRRRRRRLVSEQGPLAVPWRGLDGHERPLLAALAALERGHTVRPMSRRCSARASPGRPGGRPAHPATPAPGLGTLRARAA